MTLSANPIHITSLHDAITFLYGAPFFSSVQILCFIITSVMFLFSIFTARPLPLFLSLVFFPTLIVTSVIDKHFNNAMRQCLLKEVKNVSSKNTFSMNIVDPKKNDIRLVHGVEDKNKNWQDKKTVYIIKSLECSISKYEERTCFVFFTENENNNGRIYEMNLTAMINSLVENPEKTISTDKGVLLHSDGVRFEKSDAIEKQ